MVLVHRSTILIVFSLVVLAIALLIFYMLFLNQSLELVNTSYELSGQDLVFYSTIKNNKDYNINNINFTVEVAGKKYSKLIDSIDGNQNFPIVVELPLTEPYKYDVFVSAPFAKTIHFPFQLDEKIVHPVETTISLDNQMSTNKDYELGVEICNVSQGDLIDIAVIINTPENYFDSKPIPTSTSLAKDKCKHLNYTLTPIKNGDIIIGVVTRVNKLELVQEKNVVIS
jgi:hypothetical protein